MLNEQTVRILNQLKLFGMAESFSNKLSRTDLADLSHAEFVGLLVEDEKTYRENKRLTRLLKNAHLKEPACLEDVDYRHPRGLQKQMITELSKGDWLTHHQNILITGPIGIGKTWLSSALGNQACRLGFSTETLRFPRLVEILYASRVDGSHLKQLSRFAKVMVLIVDDFALSPLYVYIYIIHIRNRLVKPSAKKNKRGKRNENRANKKKKNKIRRKNSPNAQIQREKFFILQSCNRIKNYYPFLPDKSSLRVKSLKNLAEEGFC